MTAAHAQQLVDGYLGRLELALLDLPAKRRQEIVDDLRAHIADERSGLKSESDADLMNLLDRLGDPAEIAAAARDGQVAPPSAAPTNRVGLVEVLALVLTPFVWPAGVILLWASSAWATKQKLIGTLVPPGGYPGVLLFWTVMPLMLSGPTYSGGVSVDSGGNTNTYSFSPPWYEYVVGVVLFLVGLALLAAPVVVGIYLATRLRSRTEA